MKQENWTKENFKEVKVWLENSKEVPTDVKSCLMMLIDAALKGERSAAAASRDFHQLLVIFGLKPSSEKTQNRSKPAPKEAPLPEEIEKLKSEIRAKFEQLLAVMKKSKKNQKDGKKQESYVEHVPDANRVDLEKARDAIQNKQDTDFKLQDAEFERHLCKGNGRNPEFAPPPETIFPINPSQSNSESVHFSLSKEEVESTFGKSTGLERETVHTTRMDFSLQTLVRSVSYETARNPITNQKISAAPESVGPKGFQVSLRAIVNLVIMSVAFLVPMHRIERMLGSVPLFNRTNIARYLGLVASRCLPVYLTLSEKLANADILWADATPTRVNEVSRAFRKRKQWEELQKDESLYGPPEAYPWEKNENVDPTIEDEVVPLNNALQQELGYAFFKRSRTNVQSKHRHQTMVIHGRLDSTDPESTAVFYRSCLGDVGNVLDHLLLNRSKKSELILQCDHSNANLPTNETIRKRISLKVAGCLAHIRRPFKRYFDRDPDKCSDVLTLLNEVFRYERLITEKGRNQENTLSVRKSWSSLQLETVFTMMKLYSEEESWSDQTPLGKAARQFIKHFKKLTVFCGNALLEPSNNRSERYLRGEKLSEGSSYFRDTIEGRARFDILKTLHQTCSAAGIPFAHYLVHILITPPHIIAHDPESFLPLAVKKKLFDDTELLKKYQTLLHRGF